MEIAILQINLKKNQLTVKYCRSVEVTEQVNFSRNSINRCFFFFYVTLYLYSQLKQRHLNGSIQLCNNSQQLRRQLVSVQSTNADTRGDRVFYSI